MKTSKTLHRRTPCCLLWASFLAIAVIFLFPALLLAQGDPTPSWTSAASGERPAGTDFPEDVGKFLKEFKGQAHELDPYIRQLRIRKAQNSEDKQAVNYLAAFILKKIFVLQDSPTSELESMFLEATYLQPSSKYIEKAWAQLLMERGDFENAIPHFRRSIELDVENLDVRVKLAICLQKMSKFEEALEPLLFVHKQVPESFFVLYALGQSYFEMQYFDDAIKFWEKALKVCKNEKDAAAIQQLINRAKEEGASSEGTTKDENQRFVVHYAGNSQEDIGDVTMEILEEVYDQVTSDLMYSPDIQIHVIFFRTEDFYKLNKAGKWVGALTRGAKILVPLRQGYSNINSIRGILAHEFTHVIVNLRTNNRSPVWINEGLAVWQEFQAAYGDGETMRPDYAKIFRVHIQDQQQYMPLTSINLNPAQQTHGMSISMGYLTSYLAIRFVIERQGWQGVDDLLTALGSGNYLDDALTEATGDDYASFQRSFNDWLKGL